MKKNIFIVILVLLVLGLCGYLVYDKVIDKEEKNETKQESKKEDVSSNKNNLSLEKENCIDCGEVDKIIISPGDSFTTMIDIDNKKSVDIMFTKDVFEGYGLTLNEEQKEYHVSFNKNVIEAGKYGYGHDVGTLAILYLMEDGTVEYTPVYKALSSDNFKSYGKLPVNDIVRIYQGTIGYDVYGMRETFLQKSDGKFYRLSKVLDQDKF